MCCDSFEAACPSARRLYPERGGTLSSTGWTFGPAPLCRPPARRGRAACTTAQPVDFISPAYVPFFRAAGEAVVHSAGGRPRGEGTGGGGGAAGGPPTGG